MTLSIVIVSYNARVDLENCLASLQAAPPQIAHDAIVVDNASPDRSAEAVRGRFPAVKVVALERNIGFAGGNNVGIRATSGDLVLLLNSDAIVPAGAIDGLVARLLAHPDAAVAGPRLLDVQGRTEISWGPMMSPIGEIRQKTIGRLYDSRVGPVERWVSRLAATERYVAWVSGACLLVHRRDAEAVGLLDERYFLYTEDVDFCAAMRAIGHHHPPAREIARDRTRPDERRLPAQSPGVLRETPSDVGANPASLFALQRGAAGIDVTRSTPNRQLPTPNSQRQN
jgi:N-acetylglucosaminyl-diphospho-decaprenol L-rhamnosyltransferase